MWQKSLHVATFVKSLGILRINQKRWSEAEDLFVRADSLRPADCVDNHQGTQTLEYLLDVQLHGRLFKKADKTLTRIQSLKHCIRPDIDIQFQQLEQLLTIEQSKPSYCVVCGALSKLLACARCSMTVYCSRRCQKIHWKSHKKVCKSLIVLDNEESQTLFISPVNDSSLYEMIEHTHDSDKLTASVLDNTKATAKVSPSSPTEMDKTLLAALADPQQSYFFCMNEVTSSTLLEKDGGRRRFIATAGVLTCVTVFAWSKSTCANNLGPCFGGHVSLGALLRGLRACNAANYDIDRALAPLVSQLRHCFRESTCDITVMLVGSHRAMDTFGLITMFPDDKEKWSFAWHVKTACKAALDEVSHKVVWNSHLLMRFEGEMITDTATEEKVRRENMNFIVLALDTVTGHLVTHTKYDDMESLLTMDVYNRQRDVYRHADSISPKLSIVSHQNE